MAMTTVASGVAYGVADSVTDVAKAVIRLAAREVRYCLFCNRILKKLREQKKQLLVNMESVRNSAKKAKDRTEEIDVVVEKWLKDADALIIEVEELEEKATTINKCSCGCCCKRYLSARKMTEKTIELEELIKNSNFRIFAGIATIQGIEYYSSGDFMDFESTKLAFRQLTGALKAEGINMIGAYGMGGCGKTKLVKEVGKWAEEMKLFHRVILVDVSRHPDIRKIQGNIASSLGLTFEEEYEAERARRLYMRLSNGEKILLILDNVWERLDFETIGIPFGLNHKGCCVLLTTSRLQVCYLMDCQRMVHLSLITNEEAWDLFQKKAGITDYASDTLKRMAQEIANKCEGLLAAVDAMASTLKGKPLGDWEEALENLEDSEFVDIEGGLKNPYTCLQSSYDYLKNEEAKKLFLLCSLFPENSEISSETLFRFGIGLGLCKEFESYRRARSKMDATIYKLTDSCLLLQGKEEWSVTMHGLVRHVALRMTEEKIRTITVPKLDLRMLEKDATVRDTRFLYFHCINGFPNKLDFPHLLILIIKIELDLSELPDVFLEAMKELKVLAITVNSTKGGFAFPWKAIVPLKNLRTLCLTGCKLDADLLIGFLESVEILELRSCLMTILPKEIAELKMLKLLEVSGCTIGGNPCELLGKCSQLLELYFLQNNLPDLVSSSNQNFDEFFDGFLSTLQRYHLEIGNCIYLSENHEISRLFPVHHSDVSTSYGMNGRISIPEIRHEEETVGGTENFVPHVTQTEVGDQRENTVAGVLLQTAAVDVNDIVRSEAESWSDAINENYRYLNPNYHESD